MLGHRAIIIFKRIKRMKMLLDCVLKVRLRMEIWDVNQAHGALGGFHLIWTPQRQWGLHKDTKKRSQNIQQGKKKKEPPWSQPQNGLRKPCSTDLNGRRRTSLKEWSRTGPTIHSLHKAIMLPIMLQAAGLVELGAVMHSGERGMEGAGEDKKTERRQKVNRMTDWKLSRVQGTRKRGK